MRRPKGASTLLQKVAAHTSAILFAALAPTVITAALGGSVNVMPLALGIALAHAVLLGLPLFLLLRSKGWANVLTSACGGFVIGTAPIGAMIWFSQRLAGGRASVNGIPTVVDGVITLAGWLQFAQLLVMLGALGALAGTVFWLTLKWSAPPKPAARDVGGSHLSNHWQSVRSRPVALAAIALLLAGTVCAMPTITMDRTCHNMRRDGTRNPIIPQASIELQIDMQEWPRLIRTLEEFGVANGLSFRNSSKSHPDMAHMLYLSLCNEQGVNIHLIDQRWAARGYKPLVGGGVPVGVYELRAGSGWEPLTRSLIRELETNWPGQVKFRDKGRTVPIPDHLR